MDHELIKKHLIAASTHYSGDLNDDAWHEIAWLKEDHYPERHRFHFTYKHVKIDLSHYEATNEIVINHSNDCYGGRLPDHYKPLLTSKTIMKAK